MIVRLSMPMMMLICLGLTILVEIFGAWLFFKCRKKQLVDVILVNVMTNPLVVSVPFLCELEFGEYGYYAALTILELATFLVEGLIYKKYSEMQKPFVMSLTLNAISFIFGLVLEHIIKFVII